ncbi:hypothetical protein I7I51_00146 [Histoplasma capsulatum]|uniref:Uncharacterized protein n=1 Tax=Ajellomyces capsulatus TaxID=5037 RepID=A0A8A1MAW4_AJECA|nr:hypothetical protein I7I51_00146 [Histoplasma capsulatum]
MRTTPENYPDMSITQTSVQGGATMSEHVAWCSNYEISTTGYQLSHRVNHRFRKEERVAGNGRKREHSPMMLEYFDPGATLLFATELHVPLNLAFSRRGPGRGLISSVVRAFNC